MSYPNIPTKRTADWDRRTADAVNYLLNQQPSLVVYFQGQPSDGQAYGPIVYPIAYSIIPRSTYAVAGTAATSTAIFTVEIGGVSAGTITFNAGQTDGVIAFSSTDLPALTSFEITAPSPQDATLADITLIFALNQ